MAHWKLTLSYDGTAFNGWQVQPNRPTVQGLLAETIRRVTGDVVMPQGSGRTDAGVHALGQVTSFSLGVEIPAENLQHALNRALPPDVRVMAAEVVPESFHARHSAVRKTYEYRIFPRRGVTEEPVVEDARAAEAICSPMQARYVWDYRWPLAMTGLRQAAEAVLGTHDFSSFAASNPDLRARQAAEYTRREGSGEQQLDPGTVSSRTIDRSEFSVEDGLVVYRVTGSGFLHHMVRNLVGTFTDAGAGRMEPGDVMKILAARDRSAAGVTAPAAGLFLHSVEYACL